MSSDSDSDERIGQEVERNYKPTTQPPPTPPQKKKRPYVQRIPIARRQEAINLKLLGKEDPEFHVIETNKKGSYIVRKRAKPLQYIQEQAYIPSNEIPRHDSPAPSEPVKLPQLPDKPPSEHVDSVPVITYFNTQNSVNNSLSKELTELREMYNRLEAKYGEVKKTLKKSKKQKPTHATTTEDDEPTEDEINAYAQYLYEQQQQAELQQQQQIQQQQQLRRPARRRIDINKL